MSQQPNVASSVLTPGIAISVTLVTGSQSAGANSLRALLIAPYGGGTMSADTDLHTGIAGADEAGALWGLGTPGHLAASAFFAENPAGLLDGIAPTAPSGNAATNTLVFDSTTPVTVQQTVTVKVAGRVVQFQWAPGQTGIQAATTFVAAMAKVPALAPVTWGNSSGASATATGTASVKGVWGNDMTLEASLSGGTGGTLTVGTANFAGGTTECSLTTALAALTPAPGREWAHILNACSSNADVAGASATIPLALKTWLDAQRATVFAARFQQAIHAHTGSLSALKVGLAVLDHGPSQVVTWRSARSLPCEIVGAEGGARQREESKDVNVNRINRGDMPYRAALYGAINPATAGLSAAELEDILQNGGSPVALTAQNLPYMLSPRTAYTTDAFGATDRRLIYTAQVSSQFAVARDIRGWLPMTFPGAKIVKKVQNPENAPPNVIDVGMVRSAVIARLREWAKIGVVDGDALTLHVSDGTLTVQQDPGNPNKVNIFIPVAVIPGIATWDVSLLGVQS